MNIPALILTIFILIIGTGAGIGVAYAIMGCWEKILEDKDRD